MKISASELRYVLFPGSDPKVSWFSDYKEAYRLWKSTWSATLQELDGNGTVYSDDFSRQTQVGSLFHDGRCVALGFFHLVDFRLTTARDDSYFKVWSDQAIDQLVSQGKNVMVGSNITVDPQMRGDLGQGVFLKNLLTGLMTKAFLESGADVMAGTMRKNKGMHDSAYQFGASPLLSGVIHHGVEVDLVAFYRRRVLAFASENPANLTVERLWENKITFTDNEENQKNDRLSYASGA